MTWDSEELTHYDGLSTDLLQDNSGNSEQAWTRAQEAAEARKAGKVEASDGSGYRRSSPTGNAYFLGTGGFAGGGRINAGVDTGDIAQRDPLTGNITGYRQRDRSGGSLTPGLDRIHAMNAEHDHTVGPMRLLSASGTPGLDAFHKSQPKDDVGKEVINFSWTPKLPNRGFAAPIVAPPPAQPTGNLFA